MKKPSRIRKRTWVDQCIWITPPDYPSERIALWIMQSIQGPPVTTVDLAQDDLLFGKFSEFLQDLRRKDPNSCRLIVHHFNRLDWGYQRGLADVCRSNGFPLLGIIKARPKHPQFKEFNDYEIELEIGVINRYHPYILSDTLYRLEIRGKIEPENISEWLMDKKNWVDGLLPLLELKQNIA